MAEVVYTHRTKGGIKARILADNLGNKCYPIVVALSDGGEEWVDLYTRDLTYDDRGGSILDLVEWSPWQDVKVDTKVLVRDSDGESWNRRYFCRYENGKVYTFASGCTSWSNVEEDKLTSCPIAWRQAKLAE